MNPVRESFGIQPAPSLPVAGASHSMQGCMTDPHDSHFPAVLHIATVLPALLCGIIFMSPPRAHALTVVATLPPLAAVIHMLDPRIHVECLLPPGEDPHHFRLTPKQTDRLKHADLLLLAGLDDAHWKGAMPSKKTLILWPKVDHAWMLPNAVRKALPRLVKALETLHPPASLHLRMALHEAIRKTENADRLLRDALAPYARHGVIMQHPAWMRLCGRYGIPVHAILEPHHRGGIRPRTLQKALDVLRTSPGTYLWMETRMGNRGLEWLRRRRPDTRTVYLDALGNCGESWEHWMRRNILELKRAALGIR